MSSLSAAELASCSQRFEDSTGIVFENKKLLEEALCHPSNITASTNQGRLEFLGDSVLDLVVTEHLYETYPYLKEGHLTSLRQSVVKKESLAKAATKISLKECIMLPKGAAVNDKILADTLEAVIGAIYLDKGKMHGLSAAKFFVLQELQIQIQIEELVESIELSSLSAAELASCIQQFEVGTRTVFKDKKLLEKALCHPSNITATTNQGRLEFLGNSVLDLVVTEHLYETYPYLKEGHLTSLHQSVVKKESLAKAATKISLKECIMLPKGAAVNDKILADTLEAVIGAIYLDKGKMHEGLSAAKLLVLQKLQIQIQIEKLVESPTTLSDKAVDSKSTLQHLTLERNLGLPTYRDHVSLGVKPFCCSGLL